ncbi:MAG TPA: maleylpyruvate isomerase N-terminal domain-containing protein [Acidimicrobiales bacterium]
MNERILEPEVAAYLDAVDWVLGLVASPEVAAAWTGPSSLARYSTGGVAAHVVMGAIIRLDGLLAEAEPLERRPVGLPESFLPNRVEDPEVEDELFARVRQAAEKLAQGGPAGVLAAAAESLAHLRAILPTASLDRAMTLLRVPDGRMTLRDTLRTRILEVVVHGDDLVASVPGWAALGPPDRAVDICLGVCLELAKARLGGMGALRAFTRAERAEPDALRVL